MKFSFALLTGALLVVSFNSSSKGFLLTLFSVP